MCGIIGVLHYENHWEVQSILYHGILELMNRGYDSMGMSFITEDPPQLCIKKTIQGIHVIYEFVKQFPYCVRNGMAHTRWATHGQVSEANAHPHIDTINGNIAIVHNGVIENYQYLRSLLEEQHVSFQSETDSEVIVNYLAYTLHHDTSSSSLEESVFHALHQLCQELEGTFGIIVQHCLLPDRLFCVRRGSPLLIGITPETSIGMIVSEKSGFLHYIQEYISIQDDQVYVLENDHHIIRYRNISTPTTQDKIYHHLSDLSRQDSYHDDDTYHTEKEIREQPEAILRAFNNGSRLHPMIKLGGLDHFSTDLLTCRHVYVFGCGTSYHASCLIACEFQKLGLFEVVQAFDASDVELYQLPCIHESIKACAIFISQSGETLDLYTLLLAIQKRGIFTLGIINVVDSLIARQVDAGVYMHCGRERGVASTKSFTSSILIGFLIQRWFQQHKHVTKQSLSGSLDYSSFREFASLTRQHIENCFLSLDPVVQRLTQYERILVLGKGRDLHIAREGCLKIKELCYIQAEAYSTASLKHGPFALLDEHQFVILVVTDESTYRKNANAYAEIKARSPWICLICTNSFKDMIQVDSKVHVCLVSEATPFSYLLANMTLQILSLLTCISKGNDPDFPRNLAKVVTVE